MTKYNIFPNGYGINAGYSLNKNDIQNDYDVNIIGTTINSGGKENVYVSSLGTVINTGGTQEVYAGGLSQGVMINGPGLVTSGTLLTTTSDTQIIDQGGTAVQTVIGNHGSQGVYGSAVATTINNGTQYVNNTGSASTTTINASGFQDVTGKGSASATTINSGGTQELSNGGSANGTTINSDGTQIIDAGQIGSQNLGNTLPGSATKTTINGGNQRVYGSASATTINSGEQDVYGSASSTTVATSGLQVLYNGGTAAGTTVTGNGEQALYGGTASGTLLNGGEQFVYWGSATNTTVNAQGTEFVESGGTATNTMINAGGRQMVYSGAIISNTTINGGLLDLYGAGSTVNGAITFSGTGGTLEIAQGMSSGNNVFGSVVNGLAAGDNIDLSGLAYGSGTPTLTLSGSTLKVSNGTTSESISLSHSTALNFTLTKDVFGGILVSAYAAVKPVFGDTGAEQATTNKPLADVTFADTNPGATDSLTITMSGAGGTLSGAISDGATGSYRLPGGTPTALTSSLGALTFTPAAIAANSFASTTFTLSATSSTGTAASPDVLTTTFGNGDNLTIGAVAGQDTITCNGSGDTFVFNPNFGTSSVTDFYAHLGSAAGHDTLSLPVSEFTNFAALLQDASQSGNSVMLTANNGDHLNLPNMTLATLKANTSDFKFHA